MLAQMNHVEPRARLPSAQSPKHTNAMPQRVAKTTPRNLTGLYLGVEEEKIPPPPQQQNSKPIPTKGKGRGMPSRRVKTPTEERRYSTPLEYDLDRLYETPSPPLDAYAYYQNNPATLNVPNFPPMPPPRYVLISMQRKVDILRFSEDRKGFSGNPVKGHQGRGISSTDEKMRANMYPAEAEQFWDVTKQTARQFTVPPNAGYKHMEYLNPVSNDSISAMNSRPFDRSLDDVLVEEIEKAVQLKKEVAGLIHCYNKICKGNSQTLQSLLPCRASSPSRPNTYQRTGFNVKSYRTPSTADIETNFHSNEIRPRTVGGYTDRPLVPSPYFFKLYNPPKTAQAYGFQKHSADDTLGAASGVGGLTRMVSKGGRRPPPRSNTAPMMTYDTGDRSQLMVTPCQSPRPPCASPAVLSGEIAAPRKANKVEISLPPIHDNTSQSEKYVEEGKEEGSEEAPEVTLSGNPIVLLPPKDDQPPAENNPSAVESLIKVQENRKSREMELVNLQSEHAKLVQDISSTEDSKDD